MKSIILPISLNIIFTGAPAYADAISPNIDNGDKVYSSEKPNAAFFGTGIAGRLSEASQLRFQGEHFTIAGQNEKALKSLKKAVSLDPGDPDGHYLLAKAFTKKLKTTEDQEVDKKLLNECIAEWTLIMRHDADHTHQYEAKRNLRFLKTVARAIYEKEHPEEKKKRRSLFASTKSMFNIFKPQEKTKEEILEFSL